MVNAAKPTAVELVKEASTMTTKRDIPGNFLRFNF